MANKNVTCRIILNRLRISQLTSAVEKALANTADALHTDLIQSQTMPFGESTYTVEKVYGKRGQFAKNGREYKGKEIKKTKQKGGNLQNDSTFVDVSEIQNGKVKLVSSTPYARRLYFHPEYHFNKSENPKAGGRWADKYLPGGKKGDFAQTTFNAFYKQEAGI